jgi:hypothetical protein
MENKFMSKKFFLAIAAFLQMSVWGTMSLLGKYSPEWMPGAMASLGFGLTAYFGVQGMIDNTKAKTE